jgi:hypothetical protein
MDRIDISVALPLAVGLGVLLTAVALRLTRRRGGGPTAAREGVLYDRDAGRRGARERAGPPPTTSERPVGSDVPGPAPQGASPEDAAPYAAAWRDYRRRWILLGAAVLGCYGVLRSGSVLDEMLGFDGGGRVFGFVAIPALCIALFRLLGWPCPRCGRPYALLHSYGDGPYGGNLFTSRCVHCGLPRWAERDPREDTAVGPTEHPGVSGTLRALVAARLSASRPARGEAASATPPGAARYREGATVRVVRLPARLSPDHLAAAVPRVGAVGVVVQVRASPIGGRATYLVMSSDAPVADPWLAEFGDDDLEPA